MKDGERRWKRRYLDLKQRLIKLEEEQPCEDAISRIETLKHSHIEYDDDGEGHRVVYCEDIEQMPFFQPQQRWIPVSEKMPTMTDFYLIQYSRKICHDEMAVAFYSVEEAESDENYTWEFKPICGEYKEVKAWMPLPYPYKEEEE